MAALKWLALRLLFSRPVVAALRRLSLTLMYQTEFVLKWPPSDGLLIDSDSLALMWQP